MVPTILDPHKCQQMDRKISLSAGISNFNIIQKSRNCCLIAVDTKENSNRDAVFGSCKLKLASL